MPSYVSRSVRTRGRGPGALLALGLALAAGCSDGGKPTRIVLITFDTLRWDRFDGEHAAMPLTQAAVRDGAVFDNFYAATSSTQPTHATLFTGRHPWQHGVPRNGTVLAEEAITLAERLRASGYHTAAAVASFPLHSKFGFAQGFDEYIDDFEQSEGKDAWNEFALESGFYNLGEHVSDLALDLIDRAPAGDQFFWFHYYDPHSPYGDSRGRATAMNLSYVLSNIKRDPSKGTALIESALRLYDRDVEYMDAAVARLLERVNGDDDEWDTHVVLTADHGESFGEGGSMGHGKRLIRAQVQVPLVLVSPRVPAGRRSDAAGSLDVPTTILSFAGLEGLPRTSGRDLTLTEHEPRGLFGMRRTFVEPFHEIRTNGEVVEVFDPKFYCVRDDVLHIGDGDEIVVENGDELSPERDLLPVFTAFEAELDGLDIEELMDPETLKTLEAMGYAH